MITDKAWSITADDLKRYGRWINIRSKPHITYVGMPVNARTPIKPESHRVLQALFSPRVDNTQIYELFALPEWDRTGSLKTIESRLEFVDSLDIGSPFDQELSIDYRRDFIVTDTGDGVTDRALGIYVLITLMYNGQIREMHHTNWYVDDVDDNDKALT